MAKQNLGTLSPREVVTKYVEFLRKVAEFGPQLPQILGHLQHMVEDARQIQTLVVAHFGLAGAPTEETPLDLDSLSAQQRGEVEDAELEISQKVGVSGEGNRGLRDIFTFLMQNPELLNFIFKLFSKPTT